MVMKVTATALPGVLLVEPNVVGDARGYFVELWVRERYALAGIAPDFVQDNLSRSRRGILRGLHLQHPHGQGKLVSALDGEVFDVAVDVRTGSPTFGQWIGHALSAENHHQMWIPPGFAHGFCVTSESAVLAYKCTDAYHPESELGVLWNDPEIGIEWPVANPVLSARDARHPRLAQIDVRRLPTYGG
jgi:dTDP-4-dehydrorhamnose 3,5-epimerase